MIKITQTDTYACDECGKVKQIKFDQENLNGEKPEGWAALDVFVQKNEVSLDESKTDFVVFCSNKCYENYFRKTFFKQLINNYRPRAFSPDEKIEEGKTIYSPKSVGKPG